VSYGDLDGDGLEEAAVTLTYGFEGGSGAFSHGFVYKMKEGALLKIAEFEGGDRWHNGLIHARIIYGKLFVTRCAGLDYDEVSHDWTSTIETTVYRLELNDLRQISKSKRKAPSCW
jgi:hypothetical protein